MKRSSVICTALLVILGSALLSGAAVAQECPTADTMKHGIVLINNSIPARLFVRQDDAGQITELQLDERFVVIRDQIHVHERGLFLSYEREAHINRTYVLMFLFPSSFRWKRGRSGKPQWMCLRTRSLFAAACPTSIPWASRGTCRLVAVPTMFLM